MVSHKSNQCPNSMLMFMDWFYFFFLNWRSWCPSIEILDNPSVRQFLKANTIICFLCTQLEVCVCHVEEYQVAFWESAEIWLAQTELRPYSLLANQHLLLLDPFYFQKALKKASMKYTLLQCILNGNGEKASFAISVISFPAPFILTESVRLSLVYI